MTVCPQIPEAVADQSLKLRAEAACETRGGGLSVYLQAPRQVQQTRSAPTLQINNHSLDNSAECQNV